MLKISIKLYRYNLNILQKLQKSFFKNLTCFPVNIKGKIILSPPRKKEGRFEQERGLKIREVRIKFNKE